jgi:Kef-type K+ transport system membrane component KefB
MHHLPQLLLLLTIVTLVSKGAGHLSARFGLPAVFGEILAGVLLGPSLVDLLGWEMFVTHGDGGPGSGPDLGAVLRDLADLGVILLMFVAGLETDLPEMRRVGRVAFWAAGGGVLLPLVCGALAANRFGYGWGQGFFIGAVLTATSVSISAQTLMEMGHLRSREGSTILGAAVIDDILGLIVLSIVVAFVTASPVPGEANAMAGAAILSVVARMGLFFALAWMLGRWILEPAGSFIGRLRVSEPAMAFAVAVGFLYAWAAEHLGGIAAITGAYMAGVLFGQTSLRRRIQEGFQPLTYSFFVPVFFINIGLQADVRQLRGTVTLTVVILAVAILSKVFGCGAFAWMSGFRGREALRVGVGMISRGEVGLIVAGYGLSRRLIGQDLFSVMVLMVLATTLVTPLGLRIVFPRHAGGAAPGGIGSG